MVLELSQTISGLALGASRPFLGFWAGCALGFSKLFRCSQTCCRADFRALQTVSKAGFILCGSFRTVLGSPKPIFCVLGLSCAPDHFGIVHFCLFGAGLRLGGAGTWKQHQMV